MNKIRFKNLDGTVLAFGAMPGLTAGVNETVEDFDGQLPNQRVDFNKRTAPGVVEEKTQLEKDAILNLEKRFTKVSIKTYVNAGATQAEKFDRLLNVVAVLAQQVRETDV